MPAQESRFGPLSKGTEVVAEFAGRVEGRVSNGKEKMRWRGVVKPKLTTTPPPVLITGVSPSSLGAQLALTLSTHSPSLLILASRTLSKIHLVTTHILSIHPSANLACLQVDFSDLDSVRKAAAEVRRILDNHGPGRGIDVLFNNAGINICERLLAPGSGVEMQFATNHLGPFLFTNLLLPLILRGDLVPSGMKRIVNTSSEAHRISPIRFSDINLEAGKQVPDEEMPRKNLPEGVLRGGGAYEHAVAYGQSKTANVLFAVGLNGRVGKGGVRSFAVNPGTIMTSLVRDLDSTAMESLMKIPDWKSFDQGIATMLVAALDPDLDPVDGVYLDDCRQRRAAKWAVDEAAAERLWKVSEELVGESFGEDKGRCKL
ncbi:uncharacterized protein BP5553_07089 [Venustampulla echinocandica]|uniref:NAD(P)-binding protein n=1 Tax=Venustampulla echinocandica TaxID=2656787 RepID=A0A370TIH2_9HELO|nr:uncharacterized protein BP5553_07089 [Venustampulla echinocandica]RDL35158.1 hypothetical protein BP5553_07089 [Venustampulla echinocandica]